MANGDKRVKSISGQTGIRQHQYRIEDKSLMISLINIDNKNDLTFIKILVNTMHKNDMEYSKTYLQEELTKYEMDADNLIKKITKKAIIKEEINLEYDRRLDMKENMERKSSIENHNGLKNQGTNLERCNLKRSTAEKLDLHINLNRIDSHVNLNCADSHSRSFENSYIPENPRTPKPLTFSKNRLRGLKIAQF
ncbi:hypothetical protein LXL04_008539 [Taraxacum kok-saghyz]